MVHLIGRFDCLKVMLQNERGRPEEDEVECADTGILKFVVKVHISRGAHVRLKLILADKFEFYGFDTSTKMPNLYSLDLRWRIVWSYLAHKRSYSEISVLFSVSERSQAIHRSISKHRRRRAMQTSTRASAFAWRNLNK